MTFKLRSGNKPTFKSMGSSPVKQTTGVGGDGLMDPTQGITERTRLTKEKELQDDIAYKELQDAQLRKTLEEAPWSDTRKKENISMKDGESVSATGEGGYDYKNESKTPGAEGDPNINKYKSKEQIKQDHKDRKTQSRSADSPGGTKRTKDEKYTDKQQKRYDKYQRARATGSMGLRFNLKNALLGDGLAAGFSVDKKENIIADKMTKAAEKRRDKALIKERKKGRDDKRWKNKQYKKYVKDTEKENKKLPKDEQVEIEKYENWDDQGAYKKNWLGIKTKVKPKKSKKSKKNKK